MRLAQAANIWPDSAGSFETSPVLSFGEVSSALLSALDGRGEPFSDHGTSLAINYPTLGVSADSAQRLQRGGAFNRADRQSHALSSAQVANLTEAAHHAAQIGLPFTRMITIHWGDAGVPLEQMAKATGRFIDLMSKTLARHGCRTAWLWVHENGDRKGGHCHLLAHIPSELVPRITRRQMGWLRRIGGKPYKKRVIRSKPIGGRLDSEKANPKHHAINAEVALGYVLKGASAKAAASFNLERLEAGGLVIGKRCGTSQNIGAKARKRNCVVG